MKSTMNVLIALSIVAMTATAQGSYTDAIRQRTQVNAGASGTWYELKTSDWLFFEGEASASYNLGAISAGTKVEVLKMNKHMARVRLPDGRVVFVRNRLLTSTSAPSASEKQTLAAKTQEIGRTKLHGGNPHARPQATDVAASQAIPIPREKPVQERPVEQPAAITQGTAAVAGTGTRSIAPVDTAGVPLPAVDGRAVVADASASDAVVAGTGTAGGPVAGSESGPADRAATDTNQADTRDIPVPTPRPEYTPPVAPSGTVKLHNGEMCSPKKDWQSPIRDTYRITDCMGSGRDGGGRKHAGIDLAGKNPGMQGLPIYAAAGGRVIRSGHAGGYGCLVIIQHDKCPAGVRGWRNGQGCTTRYSHMATKTVKLRNGKTQRVCDVPAEGKTVTSCTRIGGMSGTGSRGRANDYAIHLHFELRDTSESIVFNPNTAFPDIRASNDYQSAGSASCSGTKDINAVTSTGLANGRMNVHSRVSEGRD